MPSSAGECLAWKDQELAPCLLGYEVLSDVEAYWPNQVEKGSRGVERDVMRGLVRISRWWKGLRILDAFLLFFSFKLALSPISHFSCCTLHSCLL